MKTASLMVQKSRALALIVPIVWCGRTMAQSQPPAEPPENETPAEETLVDETGEPVTLEEVLVTATRTERPLSLVPASVSLISEANLREAMFRTIPESLREVPGTMIQKTGHGQGSPYIRGFTGFRTLLLIDGIRLNNSVFRDGPNQYWNTVDPQSVRRLEMVKGPSSVLYGSDAIGGTVNAITKGPAMGEDAAPFAGRLYTRLSSAERSSLARAEVTGRLDPSIGFHAGWTQKDFDDLQGGRLIGRQPRTGYEELDGDVKIEMRLAPDTRLVLAHQRVDLDDAERTHKTIFGRSFEGTTIGSERRRVLDQNRELTYLQYHAEHMGGLIDAARFSVSHHAQSEERFRVRSDGRSDRQGFDVETLGVWSQLETPSALGRWVWGVEYYRDDVDSFRRDFNADGSLRAVRIQGPVGDDAVYDLLGVYVQDEIAVDPALDVILGGRFTYARADAEKVEDPLTGSQIAVSDSFSAFVGSARFLYRIDEEARWHLFGGVSQGFRAPNLSDLTRFDTARTNEIQTSTTGLDPERFIAYEIGVRGTREDWSSQASFFYTDIEDLITRQPTGNVIDGANEVKSLNSGSGYVQGVEVTSSWRFAPDLTLSGGFTWLEGEVDTFPTSAPLKVREPISRLMPMSGRLGLRWDAPSRDVWIEGFAVLAAKADKLSTRDRSDTQRIPPGGTPGYAVLSLRGGWIVTPGFTVTAAIENLTDEDYRIHGSGVNEPGRNFVLGLEWRF